MGLWDRVLYVLWDRVGSGGGGIGKVELVWRWESSERWMRDQWMDLRCQCRIEMHGDVCWEDPARLTQNSLLPSRCA